MSRCISSYSEDATIRINDCSFDEVTGRAIDPPNSGTTHIIHCEFNDCERAIDGDIDEMTIEWNLFGNSYGTNGGSCIETNSSGEFHNNYFYGYNGRSYIIENDRNQDIDARNNWWGSGDPNWDQIFRYPDNIDVNDIERPDRGDYGPRGF